MKTGTQSQYREACEFAVARMPRKQSILNESIISAVNGSLGDYHATKRTEGSTLFISPFMAIYWAFRLSYVAGRNLHLGHIRETGNLPWPLRLFEQPKRRPGD
jgi:hypothetical protein